MVTITVLFSETILSPLPLALLWLSIGAKSMGTISFVPNMWGYLLEISDLLGDAALLCIILCQAHVYIRAAVALWRMNLEPSNMVAVAE